MTTCLRLFVLATAISLASTGIVEARLISPWSYQELFDKSDVVIIATPTVTQDTNEHINLPGLAAQRAIGIETRFTVSAVLKGKHAAKEFVLHHYRADGGTVSNGPTFVSFDPAKKGTYILFLVREADGRYAPAFGQVDPGICGINVLERLPE